jgi:hypothetical protein
MAWDLKRPSDLAEDVLQVLYYRYDVGDRAEVRGPHAVGSEVAISARRPGPGNLDDVRFVADPPEVVSVLGVTVSEGDDQALVRVRFEGPGEGEIRALKSNGRLVDAVAVEAREVAQAELSAYEDLRTRSAEDLSQATSLTVANGGEVSLLAAWLDDGGTLLTGTGIVAAEADPEGMLQVRDAGEFSVDNLDGLTLVGVSSGSTTLSVGAGADPLAVFDVTVRPPADVDAVELELVDATTSGLPSDGDLIGWVHAVPRVEGERVLGLALTWSEDGVVRGRGTWATVLSGDPTTVEVCVPDAATVCATTSVPGRLGSIGPPVAPFCSCNQSRPGGWLALLLGTITVATRRRRT